jgi:hypothetical protein
MEKHLTDDDSTLLTDCSSPSEARPRVFELSEIYQRLRPAPASVWPTESETRKDDRRRSGLGTVEMSTVTLVNNESQFNGYLRLRRRLKRIELEGGR